MLCGIVLRADLSLEMNTCAVVVGIPILSDPAHIKC